MSSRLVFSAMVYVLRTGIPWKALPREFGSASAVRKHFQNWYRAGFFQTLWQAGLAEYDGMHGISWQWQSADGDMGKAPLATECVGSNPTGRGKKGRKRSLLVDGRGIPLSIAVSGANLHDSKLLDQTLTQVVVPRPEVTGWKTKQDLCLDAGYVGGPVSKIARKHSCHARVRSRAEERLDHPRPRPRLQTAPLGCGTDPLLAQPVPQTSSQLRKDRGQLHGPPTTTSSPDLLETNNNYLRISSKAALQAMHLWPD